MHALENARKNGIEEECGISECIPAETGVDAIVVVVWRGPNWAEDAGFNMNERRKAGQIG